MLDFPVVRNFEGIASGWVALTVVESLPRIGHTEFEQTVFDSEAGSLVAPYPLLGMFRGCNWSEAVV
jgi:hypothetical protein